MEKVQQPPLWARIAGKIVVATLDNLFLIVAIALLVVAKPTDAAVAMLMAFYVRLTEVRDAVKSSEIEITLKKEK